MKMTMQRFSLLCFIGVTFCLKNEVEGFTLSTTKYGSRSVLGSPTSKSFQPLNAEAEDGQSTTVEPVDTTDQLAIPLTFDSMTAMASKAISDAYAQGMTRQSIRLLLPRDPKSGDIGLYFEENAEVANRMSSDEMILVPPDESWQGGIMQLYRSAVPTCTDILRRMASNAGGIPPKVKEDRSVDESGVDGVGLIVTENVVPAEDASCFVQPTQETVDAIETISSQAGKRLVLLMNPQWRIVDDALDTASKEGGFLGGLASFLGGKAGALKRLDDMGFSDVFILEGYVCKGGNVRLIKRFDSDWAVFAENDDGTNFIKVGTSKTRPTYQEVDKMLDDKGITLKYARDIGMAPKL